MFSLSSYKPLILPVSGAALAASLLGFWNEETFGLILRLFYSYSYLMILLPLLLLLTIRKQRQPHNAAAKE
jgi:hypothetical protein